MSSLFPVKVAYSIRIKEIRGDVNKETASDMPK
jgi:hypothetical protein